MKNEKTIPILLELAIKVAPHLDEDDRYWVAADNYTMSALLIRDDGLTISMYCDNLWHDVETLDEKKLSITGVYPNDQFGNRYSNYGITYPSDLPSIGVSASRTPAAIAADIKRRLLPDVIDHYDKAHNWISNVHDQHEMQEGITWKLLDANSEGERSKNLNREPIYGARNSFSSSRATWQASVGYTGDVKLEISYATPDQAIAILKLLAPKK